MKSNPVAAVGIAFVDLPLPIEPHLLFRISCAEMESGTGAALARLTVAQVHPSRFTRGQLLESAAQWHCPVLSIDLLPPSSEIPLAGSLDCRRAASKETRFGQTSTDVGPVVACAKKMSGGQPR